jgi:acetyltransferase-like isoleucine patch superfamily enzyme
VALRALELSRRDRIHGHLVVGPPERLQISKTATVFNALFNLNSGAITIEDWAFLAHGVMLLTGTHDVTLHGRDRQVAVPADGRDIHIERGAWLASRSMVVGPCTVGESAVVAAGAVVTSDVPPFTIVSGVPARPTGEVPRPQ